MNMLCVCDAHPQDRNKWMIKLFLVSWEGEMEAELPPLPSAPAKREAEVLVESFLESILNEV